MKCEKCGKNEAVMQYRETANGRTYEMQLCAACAQALRKHALQGGAFGAFWKDMAGLHTDAYHTQTVCPTCGMTEATLCRTGRVGCADCYAVFREVLAPYIRKLQGVDDHTGAMRQAAPAAPAEQDIAALRALQRQAVEQENYEEAARLRDEIRGLEETIE